jgi:hypothetical protein
MGLEKGFWQPGKSTCHAVLFQSDVRIALSIFVPIEKNDCFSKNAYWPGIRKHSGTKEWLEVENKPPTIERGSEISKKIGSFRECSKRECSKFEHIIFCIPWNSLLLKYVFVGVTILVRFRQEWILRKRRIARGRPPARFR